jgi:hypothetical protein
MLKYSLEIKQYKTFYYFKTYLEYFIKVFKITKISNFNVNKQKWLMKIFVHMSQMLFLKILLKCEN